MISRRPARGTIRAAVAILGGGLAGLAAALAFGRMGRRVVLLERDPPTRAGDADTLFERWDRAGIAHFRQPHNFLALARRVLLEEAPDVLDTLAGLGVLENRQYELLPGEVEPDDEAFVSICARRPVFEMALRQAAAAEPTIEVEAPTRVVGLVTANAPRDGVVVVSGVRTDRGQEVVAELVVDALGRT